MTLLKELFETAERKSKSVSINSVKSDIKTLLGKNYVGSSVWGADFAQVVDIQVKNKLTSEEVKDLIKIILAANPSRSIIDKFSKSGDPYSENRTAHPGLTYSFALYSEKVKKEMKQPNNPARKDIRWITAADTKAW